jgi:hypothetical protein
VTIDNKGCTADAFDGDTRLWFGGLDVPFRTGFRCLGRPLVILVIEVTNFAFERHELAFERQ